MLEVPAVSSDVPSKGASVMKPFAREVDPLRITDPRMDRMKYRVLVVDDSVVMRRIVRQSLESDPEIEVAGVAANGTTALAMAGQLTLDAIILGIEMHGMDGLQVLRELRARGIHTPAIMFSTLNERGVEATLGALAAGADDYVAKPVDADSAQDGIMRIQSEIIPRIKALCRKSRECRPLFAARSARRLLSSASIMPGALSPATSLANPPQNPLSSHAAAATPRSGERIEIVAIGTSTGGPNALVEVISHIPADFPVPIVIVQHMPRAFTRSLAERLTAASPLIITEGATGTVLWPGRAWIAPGDFHMTVGRQDDSLRLNVFRAPPENSCRPSVDVLFRSVAQACGAKVLAVVMTGMGQDGLRGCEHVKAATGEVIVQDETSSMVWGMPGCIAKAGLADCILPVSEIAGEIVRRVHRERSLEVSLGTRPPATNYACAVDYAP
jgi:two-component system chemotaxis response regulator CheB